MLEAVERGIEGARLNLQLLARDLLDGEQHAVAVERERTRICLKTIAPAGMVRPTQTPTFWKLCGGANGRVDDLGRDGSASVRGDCAARRLVAAADSRLPRSVNLRRVCD